MRLRTWNKKSLWSRCIHTLALSCGLASMTMAAEPFQFEDVTIDVVDDNPAIDGNVFDHAFMDINDDNLLDIVINNHNTHDPRVEPVWLGQPGFTFKYWKNLPEENRTIAGFWLTEVDHNGDGKTDIVFTGNEGGVMISHNQSPAGSQDPSYNGIKINSSSSQTGFVDFDGDGELETLIRPGRIYKDITQSPIVEHFFHGTWTLSDFNNDGWIDMYATGRQSASHTQWNGPLRFYRNNQGNLEEIQGPNPVLGYLGGIARTADFNNDGNMDLYLLRAENTAQTESYPIKMFLGDGNFGFVDVTDSAGFTGATDRIGYSHVYVVDIDNDTHVDIVNQSNYGTHVWRNNGDGTFTKEGSNYPWAPNSKHVRFDDYDMDGKLDTVTGGPGAAWQSRDTSISVFRNISPNSNNWFKLQLRQSDLNTQAIGAAVRIYKAGTNELIGHKLMMSETMALHPRLHFGLGTTSNIDVHVTWPTSKTTQTFSNIAANRYVVLRENGSVTDVVYPTVGGNNDPIANAGADQIVTEGVAVALDGTASTDSDGSIASYAWQQTAGPSVSLSSVSAVSPTFTAPAGPATLVFQLTVTDNESATDTDLVQIIINGPQQNNPPVANAGADQTINDSDSQAGESVTLDASASTDDGSIVSYVWSENDSTIATGVNPTISLTDAVHNITLTVTDDGGLESTDVIVVTVNAPAANTLTATVTASTTSGLAPLLVNFTGSANGGNPGVAAINFNDYVIENYKANAFPSTFNVEDAGATLRLNGDILTRISFPYTVTADTIIEFDFKSSSEGEYHSIGLITAHPWENPYIYQLFGTDTVGVQAQHNYTASDWQSYQINVNDSTGDRLYLAFSADDDASGVAESLFRNVKVYENGQASGGYTYSWDFGDGSTSNEQNPSHNYTTAGVYTATLTVSDGTNNAIDSVEITVNDPPQNNAPVANAGADQTINDTDSQAGESVTLDASSSTDADGSIVGYSWSESGSEIASGVNPTISLADGVHTITLTVTDNEGAESTDDVIIAINAPTANGLSANAVASTELGLAPLAINFTGTASGGNPGVAAINFNDYVVENYKTNSFPSTFTIEDNGSTLRLNGDLRARISFPYTVTPNTIIEFDFKSSSEGDFHTIGLITAHPYENPYLFQLYGNDAVGDQSTNTYSGNDWQSYRINVGTSTGDRLYLGFGADDDVIGAAESLFRNVKVYEDGQSGAGYTYNWDFGDGSTSTEQNPSHTYTTAGVYTATLTVSDGTGSAIDTIDITVNDPPQADPLNIDMLMVTINGVIDGGVPPYSLEINGVSATVENDGSWQASIQLPAAYSGTVEASVTDAEQTVSIRELVLNEQQVTVGNQ